MNQISEQKQGTSEMTSSQRNLVGKIEALHPLLKKLGYNCIPYSKDSLTKLPAVDERKIDGFAAHFHAFQEILGEIAPDISDEDHNLEISYLKRALSHFGMRVEDEFWKVLEKNDVIEVYGCDMIQRYRSLNFFRNTGYSLLDLVVNEWYVLWDRPSKVLEKLMTVGTEVLEGRQGLTKLDIRPHIVKEILDTGSTQPFEPFCLSVEFKYIIPVYKSVGNEVAGCIITSSCEILSTGRNTDVYGMKFL